MALTVGDREVRPLTADEVLRMVELGILSEDEPLELLCGVLTEVSPKSAAHGTVMARLVRWLVGSDTAGRFEVRTEHPLVVPDRTSLPEPDIAVVMCDDDTTITHPTTAALVIEVAVSSVRTDTTIKPALYAAAAVPELWVVDIPARRLQVFREPRTDGYAVTTVLDESKVAQPLGLDVEPIDLAALLAGL